MQFSKITFYKEALLKHCISILMNLSNYRWCKAFFANFDWITVFSGSDCFKVRKQTLLNDTYRLHRMTLWYRLHIFNFQSESRSSYNFWPFGAAPPQLPRDQSLPWKLPVYVHVQRTLGNVCIFLCKHFFGRIQY